MNTASVLAFALLAGCNLDFGHGASSDPSDTDAAGAPAVCGDGVRAPHEVCGAVVPIALPAGATSARLADLDGDGRLDLIYGTAGAVGIRRGDGHGNFGIETAGPPGDGITQLAFGKVGAAGVPVVVVATAGDVTAWERLPGGEFDRIGSYSTTPPITAVAIGDVDPTSGNEIAVASGSGFEVAKVVPQAIVPMYQLTNFGPPKSLALVDFGDNSAGVEASVLVAKKDDSSWAYIVEQIGELPRGGSQLGLQAYTSVLTSATAADLTGDGVFDLIVGCSSPPGITMARGAGPGTTTADGALPPIDFVEVGDLDGDGHPDVIAGSLEPQHITVVFGETGSPVVGPGFELAGSIAALHVDGDANGDGIPDPVITYAAGGIAILMSSPP